MSDISLNIVLDNNNIGIVTTPNDIVFTPNVVSLNLTTGSLSAPGGNTGDIQYNNAGILAGVPNVNYLGGNLNLGSVANVKILGGNTAYYLQTDGVGNLTWAAGTANVTGNGTAAGANNAIQLSDGVGTFKVGPGFNFDPGANVLSVPGNVNAIRFNGSGAGLTNIPGANVTGAVTNALNAANANFANTATLANTANLAYFADVANLVAGANVSGEVSYAAVANSVAAANVIGTVANANYATFAGNVVNSAQPNITSLGTLVGLNVTGTTQIQQAIEKVTNSPGATTGTINYDLLDQAILLKTENAVGNFILNFRGNNTTTLDSMMSSNQSITCSFINTNGVNAFNLNGIKIDGANVTGQYAFPGNISNGSTSSGRDVYTFNIIKTGANAYIVLGAKMGFI